MTYDGDGYIGADTRDRWAGEDALAASDLSNPWDPDADERLDDDGWTEERIDRDLGPETPGYAGIDTNGHPLYSKPCPRHTRPGYPGADCAMEHEEIEVPDWAQARADQGLCAFVDDWCITHAGPNSLGHYATHAENPNLD
jgi:hypothetical protein